MMTFRERLADWISRGALSDARADLAYYTDRTATLLCWKDRACDIADVSKRYKDRLDRIASEERPTSNATVKRMARIARGEE